MHFCQVIGVRPAQSQRVATFFWCWLPPYPIVNLKPLSCNWESQQQNLKVAADAFYFVSAEGIDTAITYRQLAICFLGEVHVTKMKPN